MALRGERVVWLVKGYDDVWIGYPKEPNGPPQPAPPYATLITVFFTCHRTHQFVRFQETTIARWDSAEQFETFACPHCGEIHQVARGCAYLWVDDEQPG